MPAIHWESLILFLVIGIIAGWLAGLVMKGKSSNLLGNLIVGVIGSLIGGYLFSVLGISISGDPFVDPLITAFVGAIVLLFLIKLIK